MNTLIAGHKARWRACLVGVALATLSATTAQPAPMIQGTDYQETSDIRSTHPSTNNNCLDTSFCYWIFTKVRAGKRLKITNVSCRIFMNSGSMRDARLTTYRASNNTIIPRDTFLTINQVSIQDYLVNNMALQLFKAGERPVISFAGTESTGFAGQCTIAGQITDAP